MHKFLTGRRVLVVEDEMLILMMIEDMLFDLGCEAIVTASSVDQALAIIDANVIDVAMLDSNLNGVSSNPVATKLAERGVPFFFATGQKSDGAGHKHPERPILKKPFSLGDLEDHFRVVLQTPSGAQAAQLD
jgi:DNA-binding response OmpR family regulator